jgi:undecaprenyl-diphosphatase
MSHHLTYLEAVVTGLVQGVTELFPVSSLGHNVLIPALLGGSWANTLNVSDPNSPYLAFVVGLHVATAIAMIAYFWRDWLRIVRGFFSSLRTRSVTTTDERLAWMIILATIPVGIVGALAQKEFVKVFAKPELAAAFLAINGVILLVSERMRRSRDDAGAVPVPVAAPPVTAGGPLAAGGGPFGWGDAPGGQVRPAGSQPQG